MEQSVDTQSEPVASARADDIREPWQNRPRLRGRLHQLAAVVSAFGLLWLVDVAPTAQARVAALVYGVSGVLLYLTSSTYHVFTRTARAARILRRADHSMIYILIAGTITPICVLAMDGWARWVLLITVWTGALVGAGLTATAGHRYPKIGFALYLVLGWAGVATFPAFIGQPARLVLVITAGLLYTLGAILFSVHWPLPNSTWFGYHEVWHVVGVIAGALLFVVNFGIISDAAT